MAEVKKNLPGLISGGLESAAAFGGVASGFINAQIMREQGAILQQRSEFNAKMMDLEASKVLELAGEEAGEFTQQVGKLVGRQRVAFAAQGVKVGTGISRRIESQTRARGREDTIRIINMANRKARGLSVEADQQRIAGLFAQQTAGARAGAIETGSVTAGITGIGKSIQSLAESGAFGVDGKPATVDSGASVSAPIGPDKIVPTRPEHHIPRLDEPFDPDSWGIGF